MLPNRLRRPTLAALLILVFACTLSGHGQFWDFLGYTQLDGNEDHSRIQIARRDRFFGTIQLRVSGEPIFFDRVVVHFGNDSSKELFVSGRISPGGRDYTVELPGERRALESVELWYYRESWGRNPKVSLYGMRLPDSDRKVVALGE
jgi:hypothetical protein